jgi:hypothetical protein
LHANSVVSMNALNTIIAKLVINPCIRTGWYLSSNISLVY